MTGGGCGDRFEYEMNKLDAKTGCFGWAVLIFVVIARFMGWTKEKK